MLARELEARRKAGQEARRKYERRVGEEVAARRKKVSIITFVRSKYDKN